MSTHTHEHDEHSHPKHPGQPHSHGHTTHHAEPQAPVAVGLGSVVLDIGGDVGALIVRVDPAWAGQEMDIGYRGQPPHTHTGVHLRPAPSGQSMCVAVYPALNAGEYTVWAPDRTPLANVTISGARVSNLDVRRTA